MKTFSSLFKSLSNFAKVFLLAAQFFFCFTMVCLFTFIKQGISIDEYKKKKWQNNLLILFASVATGSLVGLTFFNEVTMRISRDFLSKYSLLMI